MSKIMKFGRYKPSVNIYMFFVFYLCLYEVQFHYLNELRIFINKE